MTLGIIAFALQVPTPKPPSGSPAQAPAAPTQDATKPSDATPPDTHPPAVSGGTPTITDQATLSAPGWVEFDPGVLKDLDRTSFLGTPLTLKYTTTNNHLQYLLASDGFVFLNDSTFGLGDTYPGVHYQFLTEEKHGCDVAGKFILKVPTAPTTIGTGRPDYSAFALASRDFTKWGFHGDFNAGISELSRTGNPGYDRQAMVSASTTTPLKGGRWQYTNELVYFSGIEDQTFQLTTMHGFSYAAHRFATYSAAVQVGFHGDVPRYQLLFAASFNLFKLGAR
jgi:hypothetical protein